MSAAPKNRQPWPMKWVLLAVIAVIVPYTFLTLKYRKPGPAFHPYDDLQKRANVHRLLAAGYQRIPLAAERRADPAGPAIAASSPAPGGLPEELRATLVDRLELPADIIAVSAAPALAAQQPYSIRFSCTLPDDQRQLAGADLYVKEGQIVITPTLERVAGDLTARTRSNLIVITVPAGALKPGYYHVVLAGQRSSRSWSLEVQ